MSRTPLKNPLGSAARSGSVFAAVVGAVAEAGLGASTGFSDLPTGARAVLEAGAGFAATAGLATAFGAGALAAGLVGFAAAWGLGVGFAASDIAAFGGSAFGVAVFAGFEPGFGAAVVAGVGVAFVAPSLAALDFGTGLGLEAAAAAGFGDALDADGDLAIFPDPSVQIRARDRAAYCFDSP